MPFFVRKSFRVGPLRLNLSKSGVGISGGVTGARVGVRADGGTYVHMGRGGLYYRKSLGRIGASRPQGQTRLRETERPVPDDPGTIHSADMSELLASSGSEMLDKFNTAAKHRPVAMLLLGAAALVVGGVLGSFWWTVACAVVAWYSYGVFRRSRKTRVSYEMDESARQAFTTLQNTLKVLSQTKRAWRVVAEQSHTDWKRNAGTGGSVRRADAFVGQVKAPHVETNVAIFGLKAGRFGLYFFPDALYVFDGARYGQVAYPDLQVESSYQDIVESNSVPKDASVVRRTWQYVRRDGGPDRRFTNNRQLPVVRYGFLQFTSSAGLNVHFYISNEAVSSEFVKHLNGYLSWERNRDKAKTEAPSGKPGRPKSTPRTYAGKTEDVTDSLVAAYETLGLKPGATLEQVVSAYRSLVQKYHPDKVGHLGKEFQDMAAKRTSEINRAYSLLRDSLA